MTDVSTTPICIRCGGRTERGKARVRGTLAGVVLRGASHTHVFFTPDEPPATEVPVMPQSRSLVAYRCVECATVEVTPTPWLESR